MSPFSFNVLSDSVVGLGLEVLALMVLSMLVFGMVGESGRSSPSGPI